MNEPAFKPDHAHHLWLYSDHELYSFCPVSGFLDWMCGFRMLDWMLGYLDLSVWICLCLSGSNLYSEPYQTLDSDCSRHRPVFDFCLGIFHEKTCVSWYRFWPVSCFLLNSFLATPLFKPLSVHSRGHRLYSLFQYSPKQCFVYSIVLQALGSPVHSWTPLPIIPHLLYLQLNLLSGFRTPFPIIPHLPSARPTSWISDSRHWFSGYIQVFGGHWADQEYNGKTTYLSTMESWRLWLEKVYMEWLAQMFASTTQFQMVVPVV